MNKEEMEHRCFELAEDHWSYIEDLLFAHGISVKESDIARFHYKEAFKHGYKHCWEDQLAGFEFPSNQSAGNWIDELSSYKNPKSNQAS